MNVLSHWSQLKTPVASSESSTNPRLPFPWLRATSRSGSRLTNFSRIIASKFSFDIRPSPWGDEKNRSSSSSFSSFSSTIRGGGVALGLRCLVVRSRGRGSPILAARDPGRGEDMGLPSSRLVVEGGGVGNLAPDKLACWAAVARVLLELRGAILPSRLSRARQFWNQTLTTL